LFEDGHARLLQPVIITYDENVAFHAMPAWARFGVGREQARRLSTVCSAIFSSARNVHELGQDHLHLSFATRALVELSTYRRMSRFDL
jgi:hypothetical protein